MKKALAIIAGIFVVAYLGYYAGKVRQGKLQIETIYSVTHAGCMLGALKTQYNLKSQGVILPDINEEAYLGAENARIICDDVLNTLKSL